jgi:hypothetical protein
MCNSVFTGLLAFILKESFYRAFRKAMEIASASQAFGLHSTIGFADTWYSNVQPTP